MGRERMTYDQVLEGASNLSPEEQRRLIERLQVLAESRRETEPKHSPLELMGLGKEIWRDPETGELIDAQEYVNRERDSWDG